VAGTIAGDDTLFVAVRDTAAPQGVAETLREMAGLS
jgi:arginine repressor